MASDPSSDEQSDDDVTDSRVSCASPPCYAHESDPDREIRSEAGTEQSRDWISVGQWRKQQRTRLRSIRDGTADAERERVAWAIIATIRNVLRFDAGPVAFYWPLPGEIDLRPLMHELLNEGAELALPVIVEKDRPLEFWKWDGQSELDTSGVWGIPAPAIRDPVRPSTVLVPMLGFDRQGHRLGYGGGYYDRTLAALMPKPTAIGIAFEFGRLGTVYPQGHDVPMDAIVTECGLSWYSPEATEGDNGVSC